MANHIIKEKNISPSDMVYTVPQMTEWELLGVHVSYASDASNTGSTVNVILRDEVGDVLFATDLPGDLPKGEEHNIVFTQHGYQSSSVISGRHTVIMLPKGYILTEGCTINVVNDGGFDSKDKLSYAVTIRES